MNKEEQEGAAAFNLHRRIISNETKRRNLFAENAALLTSMQEEGYYKHILGDEQAPWAGYLGEIEVFYSRNEVNDIIRIHNKLVKELHILAKEYVDIPRSRIIDILPFISASNYQEWFDKARVLTGRDWLIEVRKEKGLLTEDDAHEHNMEHYDICKLCGAKHKVNETGDSKK